jgi:hypothetical protein
LVKARFAVFFVKNIAPDDWLECEDLFTGRNFFLPNPAEEQTPLKDLLFMGHLFSDNMVLVNYVMSVSVSVKLRRRIKEEVNKQRQFFLSQEPGSSWEDFFGRHAVAVRHTIDIFTNFSKLNAVADVTVPKSVGRSERIEDAEVTGLLLKVMADNLFSFHDRQLALRIWFDYCGQKKPIVKKPHLWAAGVVAVFIAINSSFDVDYDYISHIFCVPLPSLYRCRSQIAKAIGLEEYDLRYLNEEGFITLLMNH